MVYSVLKVTILIHRTKSLPWQTLAPQSVAFIRHPPMHYVCILTECFYFIECNFLLIIALLPRCNNLSREYFIIKLYVGYFHYMDANLSQGYVLGGSFEKSISFFFKGWINANRYDHNAISQSLSVLPYFPSPSNGIFREEN